MPFVGELGGLRGSMWERLSLAPGSPQGGLREDQSWVQMLCSTQNDAVSSACCTCSFKHHPWCLSSLRGSTSLWELLARQWDLSYMGSYIQLRSNHPGTEKTAHSDCAVFILQIN